jgi:hypothetical protein
LIPGLLAPLHGLGGSKDLPIPAPLAITGGTAALIVSFCVLILAWRSPRYGDAENPRPGRALPAPVSRLVDSEGWQWALRLFGLVFAGYVTWALLAGPDLVTNPAFGVFYVLLWVGIVPASLFFGRFYRAVSPVRTINLLIAKATGGDPAKGIYAYPERLGYWPAAIGVFAFVWQELVNPDSAYLGPVRLWLAAYLAAMLIGAAVFGEVWFARADPFEVYSSLLAKLSPWARGRDGALVLRSPLANLATLVPRPGLVAVVAVLFGSTAFDSYKDTLSWVRLVDKLPFDVVLINTVALTLFCAAIAVSFGIATMSTGVDRDSPYAATRRVLPRLFGHSVIPIIVGYMTAHYLSYFVEQGQTTILQLSDPMVDGSNLLGTANWSVNYWLSFHPSVLASVKVLAVVIGHVVGVVAAHDRAISLLPKKHQVTGQIGLLVIMVAYTATGLYLLFGAGT